MQVVGGRLDKTAQSTVDVTAVEAIKRVRADLCFLGICGLDAELGISVPTADEAAVKHALISQAAEVVAIAEADRRGTADPYFVDDIKRHFLLDYRSQQHGSYADALSGAGRSGAAGLMTFHGSLYKSMGNMAWKALSTPSSPYGSAASQPGCSPTSSGESSCG